MPVPGLDPGIVPAIHVFPAAAQTWMPGTSLQPGRPKAGPGWPGMTECVGQVEREPALEGFPVILHDTPHA